MIFKKSTALFLAFTSVLTIVRAQMHTVAFNKKIEPVAFIKTQKDFLLVSDTAIFKLEDKSWKPVKYFLRKVTSAVYSNNRIWVGNAQGLCSLSRPTDTLSQWHELKDGKIEVLSIKNNAKTQEIYISTANDGAFAIKDTTYSKSLVEHVRTEDACICGTYTWIATNTGLIRMDKAGKIQIYAEEGVGGFEIPDNIVEKLFCLEDKHLTVIMSEGIAFLETEENNTSSHAEGFEFLGRKGNKIFDQLMTPMGDFIFLTQDGMLYMKGNSLEAKEHHASTEVYNNTQNPRVLKIKNTLLQESLWRKGFFDEKGNLWLASDYHVLKLNKKELKNILVINKE